ncbi:DUF4890 domain-containing protein [Pontibacter sp. JH31]|uniref:DUF4890 domain-containing protein n=1 Tax=Pontibacter aquaedesilientis TaxID=2766980 RepID=A0ABR7XJW1_9BACT|nr:DUF4890 domain-containing protein [Pontibacter aquaedesilientis]MBD1398543.1 DUF4890 domain-containing protein [Pontibacter aquaedesilientis]
MKKLIAVLSIGMLVAGSSYAQTTTPQKDKKPRSEYRGAKGDKAQKTPEEKAQMKTDRMAQKLELNASQKNKLQALNLRHAQEMKAMHERYKATGEKTAEDRTRMQEARKVSHDKWKAELKRILTAEQFAKFEADRDEMHDHMKHKRGEDRKGHKGGEHKK